MALALVLKQTFFSTQKVAQMLCGCLSWLISDLIFFVPLHMKASGDMAGSQKRNVLFLWNRASLIVVMSSVSIPSPPRFHC